MKTLYGVVEYIEDDYFCCYMKDNKGKDYDCFFKLSDLSITDSSVFQVGVYLKVNFYNKNKYFIKIPRYFFTKEMIEVANSTANEFKKILWE